MFFFAFIHNMNADSLMYIILMSPRSMWRKKFARRHYCCMVSRSRRWRTGDDLPWDQPPALMRCGRSQTTYISWSCRMHVLFSSALI